MPIALGVVIATLALVFTLTGNVVGVFFLMPVAIIAWFVFIRPTHRKRYTRGDRRPAALGPARRGRAHAGGWCRPNAEP